MLDDLEDDVRSEVLRYLPYDKSDPKVAAELAAMNTSNLLIRFFNWHARLVAPVPRTVHRSAELVANPLAQKFAVELASIISKLERGENVKAHLSKGIAVGYQPSPTPTKDLKRQRDLDLLLNDWGIHHLHLSDVGAADGFVTRTPELLFAAFTRTDAYLIDIMLHGGWADDHLISVIVNNWPNTGLVRRLNGILASNQPISTQKRSKLREAGLMTPVEIGGAMYLPSAGFSTAGTSVKSSVRAGSLRKAIQSFCARFDADPTFMKPGFAEAKMEMPEDPKFRFMFEASGYGLIEQQTNVFFLLDSF